MDAKLQNMLNYIAALEALNDHLLLSLKKGLGLLMLDLMKVTIREGVTIGDYSKRRANCARQGKGHYPRTTASDVPIVERLAN